jgi:hypothetical protein
MHSEMKLNKLQLSGAAQLFHKESKIRWMSTYLTTVPITRSTTRGIL